MSVNVSHIRLWVVLFLVLLPNIYQAQIISQYVETDDGTTPKGVEIWNNTVSTLDFSINNLVINRYANGSTSPTIEATISTGTLSVGEVLVIGSSDLSSWMANNYPSVTFVNDPFSFNGDDALEVIFGGTTTDVFGTIGSDPGSAWTGGGVSTADSNIGLLNTINTGTITGFTDPSARFEVIESDPSILTGFGIPPVSAGPQISTSTVNGLNYVEGNGPSNPQSFEVSGTNLDGTDVNITAPTIFQVSDSQFGSYGSNVVLNNFDGTATPIWVRLESGLLFGSYSGVITVSGGGSSPVIFGLNGNVTGEVIVQQDFDSTAPVWNYTNDVPFFDNGWGSGFYGLINSSSISPLNNSNFSGNILGENDLADDDGDGTNDVATLSFENINISGYTNVQLSFDYQFVGYDGANDEGSYEVFEDDTSLGQVFLADGSSPSTENTSGSETISINADTDEVSFNYLLENDGQNGYSGFDNLKLTGLANDTDTDINPPASQVVASDIIVDLAINVSNSVPVFKFDVEDIGGDGLVTELTHVRVIPGSNNTVNNWSEVIAGIRIEGDGNNVSESDQIPTINDDEIIIEVTTNNGEMTITNGMSKEYTISVFINPDFAVEGQVIQMAIDNSNDHFFVNPSGSMISRNIAGFEGDEHTLEIVGNKLEFLVSPATTIIDEAMNTVQVAYTDDQGNVDTDFNASVSISSTGTLTGDPVSVFAVDGIASFSSLVHTSLGSNLTLTASSSGESDIVSSNFNIISLPELFISEVADPDISGGLGKFVELYNAGTTPINFGTENYYLVRESNGGGVLDFIELVGSISAKGYYTIGEELNFNSIYGFDPDHNDNFNTSTVSGNGNDSYFISRQNTDDNTLKNSRIDIYGVIGVDGTGEDWEYTNGRASRKNPEVKNSNTSWTISEWDIETYLGDANGDPGLIANDMTPGYGDNDYIYDGDWNNIGLGNPNAATPTEFQNIFIRSDSIALTQDTTIGDLVVRENAILTVMPNIKLKVQGDIVNEGRIIFDSDATGTAVLETLPSNTRINGNGFEIRRHIPSSNRAFRYLSSSVMTTSTINENWQEGADDATNFMDPYSDNTFNPYPGFGTHITNGQEFGTVGVVDANGFDETETGNPSMFSWDNTGQVWNSIANTNNTTFSVGDAYAILIRGDRSSPLNTNDQTGPSTTLRTTGQIHIGDFPVPNLSNITDNFNFVGNPYQSQVDLVQLLNNSTEIQNIVYVWDPTLGTLGGYANIDFSMTGVDIESFPFGSTTPVASNANQYLQPQQAFFVKTTGTSPNPSITFTEDVKVNTETQTTVFSTSNEMPTLLDVSLKCDNGLTYDGLRIVYDNSYSNAINDLDAYKFWNNSDYLSIVSNATYLSVEKRGLPLENEVTPLYFSGQTLTAYTFEFMYYPSENDNLDLMLVDNYTGLNTIVSPNTVTSYGFTVDANVPLSVSSDRFSIVYSYSTLGISDHNTNSFAIYPNPLNSGESLFIKASVFQIQDIERVELINLQGQVLEVFGSNRLEKLASTMELSLKNKLSTGTYLLKVTSRDNTETHKIIMK